MYHESKVPEGGVELELALGGCLYFLAEALESLLQLVAQLSLSLLNCQVVPIRLRRLCHEIANSLLLLTQNHWICFNL